MVFYFVRMLDLQRKAFKRGHRTIAGRLGVKLAEMRVDFPHLRAF
jgi:hypothetical protein